MIQFNYVTQNIYPIYIMHNLLKYNFHPTCIVCTIYTSVIKEIWRKYHKSIKF